MTLALPTFPALLQRFFTQRLMQQKRVSAHTIRSYRDTFRLLLCFARKRLRSSPDRLAFEKIDAPFISAFLSEIEKTRLLKKHLATTSEVCASLKKKHITFHCLRHTAAMDLLHAGVEQSVIALWLGHESIETTQVYLDADLALKEKILARTIPFDSKPGKFRPDDRLLTFLNQL